MDSTKGSKNKKEELIPECTGKPPVDESVLYIENLEEVIKKVKEENAEKKINPSMLIDGESGINFIEGQPHLVIDNEYVPHEKAQIILQTRKVVREYLKLQNLINGIKEE